MNPVARTAPRPTSRKLARSAADRGQAAQNTASSTLRAFEAACYQRRHAEAIRHLLALLSQFARGDIVKDDDNAPKTSPAQFATRFVAALVALVLDPSSKIDEEIFNRLVPLSGSLKHLIDISAFGSCDHALRLLLRPEDLAQSNGPSNPADRLRFNMLFTIDSEVNYDVRKIYDEPPSIGMFLVLHMLAGKPVGTLKGQERREQILDCADRLPTGRIPQSITHLVLVSNAWMDCSYASHRHKHAIKARLNTIVRDWALRRGLRDRPLPAQRRLVEKPTMVVVSERMHSNHVQYRYFGQWLRQLRQRFHLALVTENREIDEHCRALFDETFGFERNASIRYFEQTVDFINGKQPDVLFYPSVGMRHWGVVLANLRLAPIQFTALGHSASTFCPTIDYYAIERGYVGDPDLLSEKLILLEDTDLFFERSPYYRPVTPELRERPQPLRVALASNLLKLNPPFLHVCAEIAKRSQREIEFHVFPASRGLEYDAARRIITRIVPRATVYPAVSYPDYLQRLNTCDLSLSPWPFGGLHSVVDALRQGIPVVAMEGLEPHSRTDSLVLRRVGMPDWLLCRDTATYIETALRVIENDALRLELARHALACDVNKNLFGDGTTPLGRGVLDSIWGMYRHHERIQADPRKVWSRADLAALDRASAGGIATAGV